jgi:hypothetical protein
VEPKRARTKKREVRVYADISVTGKVYGNK